MASERTVNASQDVVIPLDQLNPLNGTDHALHVQSPDLAIQIKNLNLTFGSKAEVKVLTNLCMQVPRGSIYALLGPSGCGKTSLIRCILGTLDFTSGSVKVLGHRPGTSHAVVPGPGVGYMPQETSLFTFLTIEETLRYFANLYNLSPALCQERIKFLVKFLDLPPAQRSVGIQSGGQKRRVSLAAALIHKPQLLVLDEPTVGVDPLLRKSIWKYLVQLSHKDNLTILVTTHHVNEASCADLVGILRKGQILEQDKPDSLVNRYQANNLEDVFLKLCAAQEAANNDEQQEVDDHEAVNGHANESNAALSRRDSTSSQSSGVASIREQEELMGSEPVSRHSSSTDMSGIVHTRPRKNTSMWSQFSALVSKNYSNLRRSTGTNLFQFALPILEVALFCFCIGLRLHSIPVAIYDGDNTELSSRFISSLDPFLIKPQFYATEHDALKAVRNGSAICSLSLYGNFSKSLHERILMLGQVSDELMENSTIHLHPDMSNPLMIDAIYRETHRSFITIGKQYLEDLALSPNLLEAPVHLEEPVYGLLDPEFKDYMAPGVILSIAFLAAVPLTTIHLVMERKDGTIERTLVAGVSHFIILLAHLVTQTLALATQVIMLMFAVFSLLGIEYQGSLIEIVILTLLQSICGMSFGLLVSAVSSSANMATMLSLGVFYPMLLLSGTVWPIEAMHPHLRAFALYLPQTIPISSMRNLMARGWSITNTAVWEGFFVSIVWIGVFLILATIIFRYRKV